MSAALIEKFWRLTAQEDGEAPSAFDLLLFSALGDPWSDETVWAKQFTEELWALPKSVKRLNLHVNSPGGSVSEAQAIYSALADHQSEKIVYVDGIAASAATIPMMAGHKVYIRSNANMMIHLPMAQAIGNADVMRDAISMLESVTESIVNVYQKKTGQPRDKLRALMAAETWMTPAQAVELGFADEIRGVIKAAACLKNTPVVNFNGREFDLGAFKYKNVPPFPKITMSKPKKSAAPKAQESDLEEFRGQVEDAIDEHPDLDASEMADELEAIASELRTEGKIRSEGKMTKPKAALPAAPPTKEKEPPPPLTPEEEEVTESEPVERDDIEREVGSILKQFPRGAGEIRTRAVANERKRLAELDEFAANPACAELVAAAKADGRTLNEIGLELARVQARDGRHRDADILKGVKAGEAPFAALRPGSAKPAGKDRSSIVDALVNAGKNGKKEVTEFELVKKKRN